MPLDTDEILRFAPTTPASSRRVLLASSATIAGVAARRMAFLASVRWWPLLPASAVGVLTLLAYRIEKIWGPVDLGDALAADPQVAVLRLVAMLIALTGILPVLSASRERSANLWSWAYGAGAVVAGLALSGSPAVALPLIVLGALGLVHMLRVRGAVRSWIDVAFIVAVASLVGASTWEVTHRVLVARYLERDVAPELGPPTAEERNELRARAQAFFDSTDLLNLAPADPLDLDESDLAFEFGVPLDPFGAADSSPELWQALRVPGWDAALIEGEADLLYLGESVGRIHYALLPRPGFRLMDRPAERLASRLVEGSLAGQLPIEAVIQPGQFAVFEDRPRASLGPRETPPLTAEQRASRSFATRVGGHRIRGWRH